MMPAGDNARFLQIGTLVVDVAGSEVWRGRRLHAGEARAASSREGTLWAAIRRELQLVSVQSIVA